MSIGELINLAIEHGMLATLLGICVFAIYKLLIYIDKINNRHEERIKLILADAKKERENTYNSFKIELNKLEDSHNQLILLYKDLKHMIDKLIDKL